MSDAIDLSIVIGTWNRAAMLQQALEALAALQPVPDWRMEILIVDNNSTDETRAVVERWQARLPGLRYLFEASQGVTFARNHGIREARGAIVALLDDDVIVEPQWLQAVAGAFRVQRCDVLQGRVRLRLPGLAPSWFSPQCAEGLAQVDRGEASAPLQRYLVSACVVLRREVFDRFGFFNTDLGPSRSGFNDDTEFSKRIRGHGLMEWYEPKAAVWHLIPPERMTRRYFLRRSQMQGASDVMTDSIQERGWRRWKLVLYFLREACCDRLRAGRAMDPAAFDLACEAHRKWGYALAHLRYRAGESRG